MKNKDIFAKCYPDGGMTRWTVYAGDTPVYGGTGWGRTATRVHRDIGHAARDHWRAMARDGYVSPHPPEPMPDDAVTVTRLPHEAITLARRLFFADLPNWQRLVSTYSTHSRLTRSQAFEASRQEPWASEVLDDALYLHVTLTADKLAAFANDRDFDTPKYAAGLTLDNAKEISKAKPLNEDPLALPFPDGTMIRGDRYSFVKADPLPGAKVPDAFRIEDISKWDTAATKELIPACLVQDSIIVFTDGTHADARVLAMITRVYPTATWYRDPDQRVAPLVARIGTEWVGMAMPRGACPSNRQRQLLAWRTEGTATWPY